MDTTTRTGQRPPRRAGGLAAAHPARRPRPAKCPPRGGPLLLGDGDRAATLSAQD